LAARGDEQKSPRTHLPNAPPAKGYKLFVSLWEQQYEAVDEEGQPSGRQFKRLEVAARKHQCTAGALVWWDAETGAEQGVPWWRVASYEAEPRPEKPWGDGPVVQLGPWDPDHSVKLPDSDAIECEGKECPYCDGTGREGESQ
jgi:hypothetical protein